MTMYREENWIESPDGQAAMTIGQGNHHGLWSFAVWKLYDPAPDIPELGGPTWIVSRTSGLYPTKMAAEAAAFEEIDWLVR